MLYGKGLMRHTIKRIQRKLHRIGTYDVCKTSLSCFDDKRYIFDDGANSLAYLAYLHRDILNQWYRYLGNEDKMKKKSEL